MQHPACGVLTAAWHWSHTSTWNCELDVARCLRVADTFFSAIQANYFVSGIWWLRTTHLHTQLPAMVFTPLQVSSWLFSLSFYSDNPINMYLLRQKGLILWHTAWPPLLKLYRLMSLPFSGKQADIVEHRPARLVGGSYTDNTAGGQKKKQMSFFLAQNGPIKKKENQRSKGWGSLTAKARSLSNGEEALELLFYKHQARDTLLMGKASWL